MSLKVVDPIEVTEAVLTASDIPEPDPSVGEVEWSFLSTGGFNTVGPTLPWRSDAKGNTIVVSTSNYGLFVSNDKGLTWNNPAPNSYGCCIDFFDESVIYYTTKDSRQIYKSTDSGSSFSLIFDAGAGENYRDINARGDYVLAGGTGGVGAYSKDGGSSFTTIGLANISTDINSVVISDSLSFACAQTGTVVLFDIYNDTPAADQYTGPASTPLNSISYYGGNVYVGGSNGKLYVSYGYEQLLVDWHDISPQGIGDQAVLDFSIDDDGAIYVPSRGSGIFVSSNNGASWSELNGSLSFTTTNRIAQAGDGYAFAFRAEGDYDRFNIFRVGDQVIESSIHKKYQCVKDFANTRPSESSSGLSTDEWVVVGSSNKWKMFDGILQSKTFSKNDFTVTLEPATYVNTLAVLDISGVTSVRVEVDNSFGSTIYDKTFSASDFTAIYDHYTYVFYQIAIKKKLIVEDLPPLPNTTIRVTFVGSDMSIGELLCGFAINVGELVAEDTKSDRFRYREQEFNSFGYPVGQPPITVELNTYDVLVPKLNNPSIQSLLDKVAGENTLWIGDIGGGQSLTTYGFFERSPIPYDMPNDINYQITVRASV